jgi:hypothetical protein
MYYQNVTQHNHARCMTHYVTESYTTRTWRNIITQAAWLTMSQRARTWRNIITRAAWLTMSQRAVLPERDAGTQSMFSRRRGSRHMQSSECTGLGARSPHHFQGPSCWPCVPANGIWWRHQLHGAWRWVMSYRLMTHPWWWRQYVPLKRRSTIILHGSISQKTFLNFILAATRTWNLTNRPIRPPDDIWSLRTTAEWYWQGQIEELRDKLVPMPPCPPQIPHGLTRARTWASDVRGRRVTALVRPCAMLLTYPARLLLGKYLT